MTKEETVAGLSCPLQQVCPHDPTSRLPIVSLVAAALKADRSTSPDCLLTYRVAFSSASDVYLRIQ
jgi:hypothetical protein